VDVETTTAIERLHERIDELETSLRGDIMSVHGDMTSLRGDMTSVRGDIATLRGDPTSGPVSLSSLRAELREGLEDARRHAVMLNESTRDDIRLVAEAVAVLAVKIDALQR